MNPELLITEKLTKKFPGVIAVDKVSFALAKASVHGLVGENGAGKSTLVKMLDGSYIPDAGKILLEGSEIRLSSPRDAARKGIGMVYQELMLLPHQSIAENICISKMVVNKEKFLSWKKVNKIASEKLMELGFEYDVRVKVKNISVAQQQIVAIARALVSNVKVLILDEPTSALSEKDVKILFKTMSNLKSHGVSMIFISHRLEEILEICEKITVLRDGKSIGTYSADELSINKIADLIVGRKVKEKYPKVITAPTDTILKIEKMSIGKKVNNVSFEVKKGEIFGIVGAMGSGKTEIAKALFGAYPGKVEGNIYYYGEKILLPSPKYSIGIGMALVTEDRRGEGLILNQGIRFNTSIAILNNISKLNFVNIRKDREICRNAIKNLQIKCIHGEQITESLSGGNQQKVVLGKWLATKMKIIIFDEPTRGIDVGAKIEIYNIINELIVQGIGVLLFSSEVPEVCGMADKILVLYRGNIIYREIRSGSKFNEKLIQKYVLSGGGNES